MTESTDQKAPESAPEKQPAGHTGHHLLRGALVILEGLARQIQLTLGDEFQDVTDAIYSAVQRIKIKLEGKSE